ncbi:MAG TPA: adenylate/guanylate cyclase domain-containing protein [Casimicrobiaceae bacterium]|nr:adenylate/guanylate cyclase domain-containing protein [Casimicrobiaceae bacterium]
MSNGTGVAYAKGDAAPRRPQASLKRWISALRLASGLVLAVYVTVHLSNHALGVISVDWQEAMRRVVSPLWQSWPGTVLLYTSFAVHPLLGLYALWRRRTLRMPAWEFAQLALGLAIPLLLFPHMFGTRVAAAMLEADTSYPTVITAIWSKPQNSARQLLLIAVVWMHLLIGLHYWLRVRAGYRRNFAALMPLAVLLPALAVLGFFGSLAEIRTRDFGPALAPPDPADVARFDSRLVAAYASYAALLACVLVAREGRRYWATRHGVYRIHHSNGRVVVAPFGQSVLEALRHEGIPHASVCGGRARCTTCRVRVGRDAPLPAPEALETHALARIHAAPDVRLACQLRPSNDVRITPLMPPHVSAADANATSMPGRERAVAVMFVDLRESSRLGEQRLPYDVFFILNRFFSEMSEALRETHGYYSTFNGDGFMALYGTEGDLARACRDAMHGALAIQERLERINAVLAADLKEPLRAGVGIHAGDAIVGTMGPPHHPILSALGDTVNVAARLEGETKLHQCMLVVSKECVDASGVDLSGLPVHTANVRGRGGAVSYYAVKDLVLIRERLARVALTQRQFA